MRWCFAYHDPHPEGGGWTLPGGFAEALRQEGIDLWTCSFPDPATVQLPSCEEFQRRGVEVLLVFYAGRSQALEQELLRLRLGTKLLIVNELGDEPQTRCHNAVRVQLSDLSLSPDAASAAHWRGLGAQCLWFTHWAVSRAAELRASDLPGDHHGAAPLPPAAAAAVGSGVSKSPL
jgi:hypothetical protein